MKLEELTEGERFRTNYTQREGVVLHQGESGTSVKWDKSGKRVRIVKKAKWGSKQADKVCEFEAPAKPEVISSGTEVTRITPED